MIKNKWIENDIRELQEMISKDRMPTMGGSNRINHSRALKMLSDLYNQYIILINPIKPTEPPQTMTGVEFAESNPKAAFYFIERTGGDKPETARYIPSACLWETLYDGLQCSKDIHTVYTTPIKTP